MRQRVNIHIILYKFFNFVKSKPAIFSCFSFMSKKTQLHLKDKTHIEFHLDVLERLQVFFSFFSVVRNFAATPAKLA